MIFTLHLLRLLILSALPSLAGPKLVIGVSVRSINSINERPAKARLLNTASIGQDLLCGLICWLTS